LGIDAAVTVSGGLTINGNGVVLLKEKPVLVLEHLVEEE
jgi:hypothetical protein